MNDEVQSPVRILSERECWELLGSASVGRLVTRVGETVEVAPINYVVDGGSLVFRTAAGNKLAELTSDPRVVFETDAYDMDGGWSVVVRGVAHVIDDEVLVEEAERLPLQPFVPTFKPIFVRIMVDSVSGRDFAFGYEIADEL